MDSLSPDDWLGREMVNLDVDLNMDAKYPEDLSTTDQRPNLTENPTAQIGHQVAMLASVRYR